MSTAAEAGGWGAAESSDSKRPAHHGWSTQMLSVCGPHLTSLFPSSSLGAPMEIVLSLYSLVSISIHES